MRVNLWSIFNISVLLRSFQELTPLSGCSRTPPTLSDTWTHRKITDGEKSNILMTLFIFSKDPLQCGWIFDKFLMRGLTKEMYLVPMTYLQWNFLAKIVNGFKQSTIFANISIVDNQLGSKHASSVSTKSCRF